MFKEEFKDVIREIKFQEEGHLYTYQGERLNSITQILKEYFDEYDGVPQHTLDFAASQGLAIHNEVRKFIETGKESFLFPQHIKQFQKFLSNERLERTDFIPELIVGLPQYYIAGRLDLVSRKGKLIEIKTTSGKMRSHSLQIAIQNAIGKKVFDFKIKSRGFLYLYDDDYTYEEVRFGNVDTYAESMISLNKAKRLLQKNIN